MASWGGRRHLSHFLLGLILVLCSVGCSQPPSLEDSRFNVALVVLDAARADHLGSYEYTRDTTPNADEFASVATRYDSVISEAPFTFLATSSLFTAGSPAVTGLVGRTGGIVPASLELIAETAKENGFGTYAYSENPYVTGYFGLDQGFEVFEETFPVSLLMRGEEIDPQFDSAGQLTAILKKAAGDKSRPFFLYVHLLRPHNPYAPPSPYAGRFGSSPESRPEGESKPLIALHSKGGPYEQDRLDSIVQLYDENLAYGDALFGGLLAELEERGLRKKTIVILTSDHGEALGDHDRILHSNQVYDSMLRVPLIISVPGEGPSVESVSIQLADLGRGLRRYFRGEDGAVAGLTRIGFDQPTGRTLYSWTNAKTHLVAARTNKRKLIVDARTSGVVGYYDLLADPGESVSGPLDEEGKALLSGLLEKIRAWAGLNVRIEPAMEIDTEKRRQLEALGYVDPEEGEQTENPRPKSDESAP